MNHHGGIKRENIGELLTRAKFAFDEMFFLESAWIYYSLIDDRLTASLLHLGKESEAKQSNGRFKSFKQRKEILDKSIKDEMPSFVLDTILSKIDLEQLVKKMFDWAQKRNNFMHALADKEGVYGDYEIEIKKLAEEGAEIHRDFTNYVMRLKKRTI